MDSGPRIGVRDRLRRNDDWSWFCNWLYKNTCYLLPLDGVGRAGGDFHSSLYLTKALELEQQLKQAT
ncbi:MAG: hypothetical protein COZ70_05485 [Deltaproteobacteria bacterium CG_4_8_14_3_um_filter_51_11]|nr:MAG: hypothetical protein AUK25_05205 [Desulfobacteraceae bacterium CG2_30_51_40]PIW00251.1 MAG: hypothetical protein COW41_05930 [Deltaproteobacteria bacterium CG17_big_fil_post_rev_8_21_14_2_50_51_6]PIX20097.1 MAG: hypothetical protein COZ70_05485 [Deltaproteobacteria bacterium CG_4_8_14_3_um_filter_51_11]PIY22801.1 MAG: hypothetical protein COZ11_11310 [Deltaproteobacteria bacterium CG_4_10_14_3_um_filter_51_14]